MCGKRFTFLYTSPYEHVQYNGTVLPLTFLPLTVNTLGLYGHAIPGYQSVVVVLRLNTFVFNKCSEKKYSRLYLWLRA